MNEVIKCIKERRSIRSFSSKIVPSEILEQIVEAGTFAPSGRNKQDWHFTVIKSAETTLKLAQIVGNALDRGENYNFYGAPNHIIISCPKGDVHSAHDSCTAAENILLAAHSLGIATCWINQLRVSDTYPLVRKFLTELGVPQNHHVEMSIAVGYSDKKPDAPARKIGTVTFAE